MRNAEYGYVVMVECYGETSWLGRRIYMQYDSALTVKHNLMDTGRYARVWVLPATAEQFNTANSKG